MDSISKYEKQNCKTFRIKLWLWGWERTLKWDRKSTNQNGRLMNMITWKLNIYECQRHHKVQRQATKWEKIL